jgi:hypothetical protein
MKVLISVSAEQDLAAGKDFYSRRGWEIGEYFLESILADRRDPEWVRRRMQREE